MIPGHGKPLTLEASEAQTSTPLMVFECRGFEPLGFVFSNGWKAKSVSENFADCAMNGRNFMKFSSEKVNFSV